MGNSLLTTLGLVLALGTNFTSGKKCYDKDPNDKTSTIVLIQMLFRHGIRAPSGPYPTSPLTNETLYWPNGWGQLTDFGKEQNYQLGKYVKSRYPTLFKPFYHVRDLFVLGTDLDRVLMSAYLVLAAIYPNCAHKHSEFDYQKLNWEAIPVHSISAAGANRLMLNNSYASDPNMCPKYFQQFQNLSNQPELVSTFNEWEDFILNFYSKSGIGTTINPNSWWSPLFNTASNIWYEYYYNLPIPTWAADIMNSESEMSFLTGLLRFGCLTDTMKRLVGGPLIKEWIQNMKSKVAGTNTRSFYIISAHGHNLVNVLDTMGFYEPPFATNDASAIFVELHKINDENIVKLFYRDGLTGQTSQLTLSNCANPCSLDSFEAALSPFIPVDLNVECQLS